MASFSYQSLENWLYMSTFLMAKAVPMVAVTSSLIFAVSPMQTVRTIQRAGSTMQFPFAPFFFFFIQSVIYTLYGYATENLLMGGTALLSALLGSHYVFIYCKHAENKSKPLKYLASSLTAIVLLGIHALTRASQEESQLLIGVPGNILSLLTSASPLLQVKTIIRTRDASCLPLGMSVMTVVAGGVWMVYGLMLGDLLVVLPNLFALAMGLIQVGLILKYSKSKASIAIAAKAATHASTAACSGLSIGKQPHEKV